MSSMNAASGKVEGVDQLRPDQAPLVDVAVEGTFELAVDVVDVAVGDRATPGETAEFVGRSDGLAVAVAQPNTLAPTSAIKARRPTRRRLLV
jgi:hypothetical protein